MTTQADTFISTIKEVEDNRDDSSFINELMTELDKAEIPSDQDNESTTWTFDDGSTIQIKCDEHVVAKMGTHVTYILSVIYFTKPYLPLLIFDQLSIPLSRTSLYINDLQEKQNVLHNRKHFSRCERGDARS